MFGVEELDSGAVGDDVTTKTVLAAQDVGEKELRRLDRNAVVVVVAGHHAEGAGVAHGATEGMQVDRLQLAPGDLRVGAGLAVAAPLRHGIDGEVLERGDDALLLDAAHLLNAEFADEERIFAVAFDHAAPARIAGEVEHRRIHVGVAEGAALATGHATDLADERGVPRTCDGEFRGETRGLGVQETANALVGEIDGNAEARLFDEPPLYFVERAGVEGPRQIVHRVGEVVGPAGVAVDVFVDVADAVFPERSLPGSGGQLVLGDAREAIPGDHLRGLFLQAHAREQVGDAGVGVERRILVGILLAVLVEIDPAVVVDR